MDSKSTKATPAPSTERPSLKKGPLSGTDAVSPELKNTFKSHLKGLESERIAFRYLRTKFNVKLLRHRYRSPLGEVDLLLRLPSGELVVVEVKSLSRPERMTGRLGWQQQARLKRVVQWLSEKSGPVLFWLVFVMPDGEVVVMDDVLG